MKIQYKQKRNLFQTIFHLEILQGMALTLRKLFSPPITRQYPQEKPPMYPGFRGQHALVRDPQTGKTKCVACMRCATVCPSRCIRLNYLLDKSGARVVENYSIEALRCVYCGYCVEVCPVNALTMTDVFEYSDTSREAIFFDKEGLLDNWDRFVRETGADKDYVNPFWRPRGIPEKGLAAAKRIEVDRDWTIEGQYVGPAAKNGTTTDKTGLKEVDNVC
ncbi:MAG: NADH-quinone oxidoreductase subunit NuoI [Thermodesulfobacteriota bacterium]